MVTAQGSITETKRKAKPFRWRYKGADKYFKTLGEAQAAQAAFLKARTVVGSEVSDAFRAKLERYAVEAYGILSEAGLTDPRELIEAAKIRAARGANEHTLSGAIELVKGSTAFSAVSHGTAVKYKQRWGKFLHEIGDMPLIHIEPDHIRTHLENRKKTASATEAHKTHTALNALFNKYFKAAGIDLPNPVETVFKPKQDEVESKVPYTLKEINELTEFFTERPNELAVFQIQSLSGYRASEALSLSFNDFGLGQISLDLQDELTIHFTAGTTKERRQRTRAACKKLHLSLLLNDWFTDHYVRKGNMLVLKPEHTHKLLYGKSEATFTKRIKRACEACEVPYRKNSLRHTYVSAAIKGRFDGDIEKTKDSIGHAMSSAVIRNHYLGYFNRNDSEAYFGYEGEEEAFCLKYDLKPEHPSEF